MSGMTRSEIYTVVNRYIGVSGGYLGDFSYRTHAEFYLEFCDLDVNPYELQGTTRERFIKILETGEPWRQARILRGVLRKYPAGSADLRTPERAAEVEAVIARLEADGAVAIDTPHLSSDVVNRAIADAEALLRTTGAPSGIDRMHTAFHGFLRLLCDDAAITYSAEPSLTELYKKLRQAHPGFGGQEPHAEEVDRVLKSLASAVDSLNTLRNRASVAHPNESILATDEAFLYINTVRTLMAYLDAKLTRRRDG